MPECMPVFPAIPFRTNPESLIRITYLFHLFGGKRVFAAVVAPPAGPDCVGGVAAAAAASVVVLLVARLVDGLVVVGKLLGTVPPAAVQLQSNRAPWKRPQKLIR